LAPYQPIFVAITLAILSFGFYRVYRRPQMACAEGDACARPLPNRLIKLSLWAATLLVALALAFPYLVPFFLDI